MTTQDSAGGVPLDVLLEHRDWVRALARSVVGDPNRADDIEQETWRMAIERPPRHGQSVRAWFRVVVRNAARKTWRREQSAARIAEQAPERPPVPSPDDLVAQAEVQHRLVRAVLELDEPYRSAVLYRFFEGLAPRDIAARLAVPVETVRTRLKRGIARLRERMNQELGDDRRAWSLLVLGYASDTLAPGPGLASTADAGTGLGSALALGGTAVSSLSKGLAAAAVVLLTLGVAWFAQQSDEAAPAAPPGVIAQTPNEDSTNTTRKRTADAAPGGPTSEAESPSSALPPIDLDACDRERDLHGLVQDLDGTPVAGARVVVLRRPPWGQTLSKPRQLTGPAREREETLSASDGSFSLRLHPGAGVGLRVDADGYAIWDSKLRQAGERTIVKLTPAVPLIVHVKRTDGSPGAGVPVRLSVDPGEGEERRYGKLTDDQGTAVFDRLAKGASGTASLVSHALAILRTSFELTGKPGQTLELVLPPHRVLSGSVVDAVSGIGIVGARVGTGLGDSVETDEFGRFKIPVYAKSRIEAAADGYAPHTVSVPSTGDVKLEMGHAGEVSGRVIDERGHPVSGADVGVLGSGRSMDNSTGGSVTGEDGRFTVTGLVRGQQHLVRIESSEHALSYTNVYLPDNSGSGPCDLGDFRVLAPRTMRGIVVDAKGERLARIALRLSGPDRPGEYAFHLRRATDDLGRFAFTDLPPGTYEVRARIKGLERRFEVIVPASEDAAPVTLQLVPEEPDPKKSIPVQATVHDENGNPVPGVRVSFTYTANGGTKYVATDANGVLKMNAEYPPAIVSVALSKEQAKTWLRPVRWLRPGERDATISLRRGAPIGGRVVEGDGEPLVAWVTALDGVRQVAAATTDADGRFAFAVPVGAKLTVEARPMQAFGTSSRRVAVQHAVDAGTQDLKLHIGSEPEKRTVTVEVVDEFGAGVERASLQATFAGDDQMHPIMAVTDAHGVAKLVGLPKAPVTIVAFLSEIGSTPETYSPTPQRIAGDEDRVRFELKAPRLLKGRVLDEAGTAVGGAYVSFNQLGSACVTTADAEGYFELRVPRASILPAPVHASPFPFNPKDARSGYDLVESEERELTIVLRPVPGR